MALAQILKPNNHNSQLLSKKKKKVSVRFGNLEVYYFISTQHCSPYYINAYIFTVKSETNLGVLLNADCIHKDQGRGNLLN